MEMDTSYLAFLGNVDLTPEQNLAAFLIQDSMINVMEHNEYYRDSFKFLVDSDGELTFWLECVNSDTEDYIKQEINKFLETIPNLYM